MKTLKLSFLILFIAFAGQVFGQVAINTSGDGPVPSAMLEITSNSRGVLIPSMILEDRNFISFPATGLLIYQTDNNPGFYYYTGTAWVKILETGAGGALSVSNGGTGAITFNTGGLLYGNGTSAVQSTLTSNLFWNGTNRLGINTVTPTSMLHVNGSFSTSIISVTGATSLNDTHQIVLCNGTFIITLPTPGGSNNGRQYTIKNIGTGSITLSPNVDGAAKTLSGQWSFITVVSNGSAWYMIGN